LKRKNLFYLYIFKSNNKKTPKNGERGKEIETGSKEIYLESREKMDGFKAIFSFD